MSDKMREAVVRGCSLPSGPPCHESLPRSPRGAPRRLAKILVLSLAVIAVILAATPISAQTARDLYSIGAVRTAEPPVIDGVLNDDVWQSAPLISEFTQQEPQEGQPATERTEVRMLYDQNNLYFAVHALDSQPAAVIATEMRRDADRILEEDNFQIILDTFMDSRSAYMFAVSPIGAKLDQQVFEEGEGGRQGTSSNTNRDWDGVWQVEAQRTSDGWVAEIAIPMVTLRFPSQRTQSWGINFMRSIGRKNEFAYWAPIPPGFGLQRVSLAGTLRDLEALSRGRDLRVKPFVIGGGRTTLKDTGTDRSMQRDVGLDLKYGLTPGLNLDVTLNTDFAQAEVDDERVNLTRFALFFPEKRDFFIENAGQFLIGTTLSTDRSAELFFSRRIGLGESGGHVPILGGARVTGKEGRNNIGLLTVQTDEAFGNSGENFFVGRFSRDIFERSKIGAMVINKQAVNGGHYNRLVAADWSFAPHPFVSLTGFLANTFSPDVTDDQMGGHFRAGYLSTSTNTYVEYTDLQDNFNPEVGYVPRVGIRTTKIHYERNPRPNRWGIRVLEPMYVFTYTTDQTGRLVTRRNHLMVGSRLSNGGNFTIVRNGWFERLDEPFSVTRGVVIAPGSYHFTEWNIRFRSNPSARLYTTIAYNPQEFFDGTRSDLEGSLGLRVNSQLAATAGLIRNDVDLPAGSFIANVGSFRLDYALSPTMNLRGLTQYNSLSEQWSTAARFHYIYRPGSDLFIVYDEIRRDTPALTEIRDRQLIIKVTYLLSR